MGNSLNNKYGHKLLDSAEKSTTSAIKTASERAIQKTARGTGDLIDNKSADKITSVSKKSAIELHSKELHNNNDDEIKEEDVKITTPKKDTYPQKEDNKLLKN